MAQAVPRAFRALASIAVAALFAPPAGAQGVFHRAENQAPLAIVQVTRTTNYTEIHLQAQAALTKVCWSSSGPNSPYILAIGRSFRYLDGDNVTACPERRDYADKDIMVLRFEPLEMQVSTFSLVVIQMGEGRSTAARDWNFQRVPVK